MSVTPIVIGGGLRPARDKGARFGSGSGALSSLP